MHRNGFTLIEMMIVLFIGSVSVLSLDMSSKLLDNNSPRLILSELVNTQFKSMLTKTENRYVNQNLKSSYEIVFKPNGNIVQAQTFMIFNRYFTFSLGPGRLYEKR